VTGQDEFNINELIDIIEETDLNVEKTVKKTHPELNLYQLSLIKENNK